MPPGNAFVNSDPKDVKLANFGEVAVIRLNVRTGTYLVFGRVTIWNSYVDSQNASAKLTHSDGADIADRADVRLAPDTRQVLYLQGTLIVKDSAMVDIRCATYNGIVSQASLFAIEVASPLLFM